MDGGGIGERRRMEFNAQPWQLKIPQHRTQFMGGVRPPTGNIQRELVPPDKMQIFLRPANLSGASVTSGSIGGDTICDTA